MGRFQHHIITEQFQIGNETIVYSHADFRVTFVIFTIRVRLPGGIHEISHLFRNGALRRIHIG